MGVITSSKFITWEGDIYRLDDIKDDGIEVFVFKDGNWVEADSTLGATILFESKEVPAP